jgi:glycine/D-amino acid oxidase-like deaminating enzyme
MLPQVLNHQLRRHQVLKRLLSSNHGQLPSQASVVVIGGGIIGNSIAYHLAKAGMKDVVLCEQSKVTSGTTWHAAGLMVTFGSLSETSTELRKYSKKLYSSILEEETGQDTGFKGVGFIELAANADKLEEYRRVSAFNRKCGVDVHEISPAEVQKLFPLCKVDDILAGFYVKDDGRVNPVDVTMALNKGARLHGVKVLEDVRVAAVNTEKMANNTVDKVSSVTLENGHTIKTPIIVNATGMWARQFGARNGITIPNQAAEHYYLVTERMPDVDPNWPVVEDPENYTYIRPEAGGLMIGLFEGKAAPWNVKEIPNNFSFGEIEPDWERMGPYVEAAMSRVPATMNVGIKKFFCGPESFTPDLAPIVGEAPEIRNYWVAAGLNSIGILTGEKPLSLFGFFFNYCCYCYAAVFCLFSLGFVFFLSRFVCFFCLRLCLF